MPKQDKNNHAIYMLDHGDVKIIARTPSESGLDLNTLIESLTATRDALGERQVDTHTVIFQDENGNSSWTIQEVAYDNVFVRLS